MLMPDVTDISDLLARIGRRDRNALAALFDHESGRLVAIAQRIVRRRDLAEDVVQEVFITVWARADQFDPSRGSARGWLTTMTRNRALNLIRDDARVDYHDVGVISDLGDRQFDALAAFDTLSERDALRHCLGALDEPKRQAILLCYVTGLNHGEAAATLKAPLGTVKAWIRRGVLALQECLA
nr:sigma-70 family RNA polymerase sigma factor [Devosia soli]